MKKSFLFALGVACLLSFGVISFSPKYNETRADDFVMSFKLNTADTPNVAHLGIIFKSSENDIPYDHAQNPSWDISVFTSTETSALLLNGVGICNSGVKIKKIGAAAYFLDYAAVLSSKKADDTLILQGNWTTVVNGTSYSMSVLPFKAIWDGSKWTEEFIAPELETFDKVTLVDAGYDDFDHFKIDFNSDPSVWNTFAFSEANTTRSFSFEFVFEASTDMLDASDNQKPLEIRVGTVADTDWDKGHFYKFHMCNVWGYQNKGAAIFERHDKDSKTNTKYSSDEINMDLTRDESHLVEFGSIYLKNSTTKTFEFVKLDGEYLYWDIKQPMCPISTTKIGFYYSLTNIFVGSSKPQKEATDTLSFNRSNGAKGIYLNGPTNNIPVDKDWKVRGVPASKYNALKNGEPLYPYGDKCPLVKHGLEASDNYYIAFDDSGITFKEGDVVTLSNEFHFRWEEINYVISVKPVSFLFTGGAFVAIDNIYEYLNEQLENYTNPDFYAEAQLAEIDAILLEASTALAAKTNMKELWDLYFDYLVELDNVEFDETKKAAILQAEREKVLVDLNNLFDEKLYDAAHLQEIANYIDAAADELEAADSLKAIKNIFEETKQLILSVLTIQQVIEEEILSAEQLKEEYLEVYDVATTTDLNAIGPLTFCSDTRTYSSGVMDYSTRVATSSENESGNLVFQFTYRSNNPSSITSAGSQICVRLRGTDNDKTCYRFFIGMSMEGGIGVALDVNVDDKRVDDSFGQYNAKLEANKDYEIEFGAVDLKDYDRTLLFIKIGNDLCLQKIVDSIDNDNSPTVRIIDSKTADEDVTATMSPIEEGTTKQANSSLAGRLVLDPSSTGEALFATLRKNTIPVGSTLYPLEQGAFTINGEEILPKEKEVEIQGGGTKTIVDYTPSTYIVKTGTNKYEVKLGITAQDGDVVSIGGCFAAFNTSNLTKSVYRFFKTEFTYSASTSSWTQDPADLGVSQTEAIETIASYADLSKYSDESIAAINSIVETYSAQIKSATTVEEVEVKLEEGLERINAVPTVLDEYKASMKEELQSYKSVDAYRAEEKEELNKILNSAFLQIDGCSDKDSVDLVVRDAKRDIDELKTAAQRDAEDLADAKRTAKADLESYVGLLDMNRYSDESANQIQSLALKARNDIDKATSIAEVNSILSAFKEAIKGVKTNDGSTFNGETYVKASKKGCGGSVIAASSLISLVSLFGLVLIERKKKAIKA